MSEPWSDNPNAPQIPLSLYTWEKTAFAGYFVGSIFHGIVAALFFRCMIALFNPTNRARGGIGWGLVAHTVALFANATVSIAIGYYILSESYINDREFPGGDGLPPGPTGYWWIPKFVPLVTVASSVIQLNQWLVDGLLLYRCYIIYNMNYWAVVFPFVMYLASWATGIGLIWTNTLPHGDSLLPQKWGNSYYSIGLALNIVLTLMLITRLALHNRNIRKALGTQNGADGLYKTIIAMFVESGVLYALSFVLLVATWAENSIAELVTLQILPEIQCIAPFLIVLRVANRTALTSEAVASGNLTSIHFNSSSMGELTGVDGTLLDGEAIASADEHREAPGEDSSGAEKVVQELSS